MVRKDGAEARRERLKKIAQTIHAALEKNMGNIPLSKTVAKVAIETGLTREKIMEYLTLLADADHFALDVTGDSIRKLVFENAGSND